MTFSPNAFCACREILDDTFPSDLYLTGDGLWVGLISGGHCSAVGGVLAGPGDLFMGTGNFALHIVAPCHITALRLDGTAAEACGAELPLPRFYGGGCCPRAEELIALLAVEGQSDPSRSAIAYQLLCILSEAEDLDRSHPVLVAEAIQIMREDYATLYGVEELSDALGVSKCHLIRTFSAAVGVSPGQYLTTLRLAAAKELLLARTYTLDTIAGLCGFSGANYFCRVFRRVEGRTPADWRDNARPRPYAPKPPVVF